jgi:hypothetical protein
VLDGSLDHTGLGHPIQVQSDAVWVQVEFLREVRSGDRPSELAQEHEQPSPGRLREHPPNEIDVHT